MSATAAQPLQDLIRQSSHVDDPRQRQPLHPWRCGLKAGLTTLRREPVLGLKRLVLPVSYWRFQEFRYVARMLAARRGARILDVGSPKDLASFLARGVGAEIVATDILESAVGLSDRYAQAQGIAGRGPGRVHSEVQDARVLPYADESFDGAFSVSVLEHIPDTGDAAAIRELIRVVKPGGRVVVTTPFSREYRETWVNRPVYERDQSADEKVFYERHYDVGALRERLIEASGARLISIEWWGELGLKIEASLHRLPLVRAILSPTEAMMSRLFLQAVSYDGPYPPAAAFFTLEKSNA